MKAKLLNFTSGEYSRSPNRGGRNNTALYGKPKYRGMKEMNIKNYRSSSGTRPINEVSEQFEKTGKLDFQGDNAEDSYLYGNMGKETRSVAHNESFDDG